MKDKTKEQIIIEMEKLHQRTAELETEKTEQKKTERELEHLNLVLRTIRNVNQLINREKDPDKLIQGVCDCLTSNPGFYSVWIALFDESGKFVTTAKAGLGRYFPPLLKLLRSGKLPKCGQKAMKKPGIVMTKNPLKSCKDCPLAVKFDGKSGMTIRLEYGEKVYGILNVSFSVDFSEIKEKQDLFKEVAHDISFALYTIELEEKRRQIDEERRKSEEHFRDVIENIFKFVPEGLLVFTDKMNLFKKNKAFQDIVKKYSAKLNYTEQELTEIIVEQVKNRILNEDYTEIKIPKK